MSKKQPTNKKNIYKKLFIVIIIILLTALTYKAIIDDQNKKEADRKKKLDQKIEMVIEDSYVQAKGETIEDRIKKVDQVLTKHKKDLSKDQITELNFEKLRLSFFKEDNKPADRHQVIDQVLELDLNCEQIEMVVPLLDAVYWHQDKYKLLELYQKQLNLIEKCQKLSKYQNVSFDIEHYQSVIKALKNK